MDTAHAQKRRTVRTAITGLEQSMKKTTMSPFAIAGNNWSCAHSLTGSGNYRSLAPIKRVSRAVSGTKTSWSWILILTITFYSARKLTLG